MKNFWSILLLIAILQSLTLSILAGHHNHGGSNIAHILAAGLIVQLLSKSGQHGHHHHHHGHHGRHGDGNIHSEYSPYGHGSWVEESRMNTESTLSGNSWAQAPLDLAYAHSQYKEPIMESYNMPYYYHPQTQSAGLW